MSLDVLTDVLFCEGAMEALLLEKTRNLEHQLTTTRLRLAEASGEIPKASMFSDLQLLPACAGLGLIDFWHIEYMMKGCLPEPDRTFKPHDHALNI